MILAALTLGIGACSSLSRVPPPARDINATRPVDGKLTVQNGVLRQTDPQGRLLWQIKVKQAVYSQDQKNAQVKGLNGELFQDGKSVFRIQAEQAEIYPETQKILLKGQVVVTDIRDGVVLQGRELEWRPQVDLLRVRQDLRVTHPQIQLSAQEVAAHSRTRQIEVQGQVVALITQPSLRLRSEQMVWQLAKQKIAIGSRQEPASQVQIEHLGPKVDRAVGRQAEVNLSAKVVTLQSNARLSLISPPLEVASQQLVWDLNRQTVTSSQPIRVQHRNQKVMVTANQGILNLSGQRIEFLGSVQTAGQANQAFLRANQLTWLIPSQAIEAQGDVVYQQNQPKFELRGPRAFGKFQEQAVLISGGRVVTEIIP